MVRVPLQTLRLCAHLVVHHDDASYRGGTYGRVRYDARHLASGVLLPVLVQPHREDKLHSLSLARVATASSA